MNTRCRAALVLVALLCFALPAQSQEYKETYNTALEAANAKDYATARGHFAEAADGADAEGDAEIARRARYAAAQMDNRLGNAALRAEDAATALAHYQAGVAMFPSYIKNAYGHGLALKKLGRMEEALDIWQSILDNTQDRKTALAANEAIRDHFNYHAASALSKRNPTASDGDRALAALEQSLKYVEADSEYYYFVAVAQFAKGNSGAAIAAADQSLALHRGSRTDAAKIHFIKGEAQVASGDRDGAKASFENALYGSYKSSAEHYLNTL